MWSNWLPRGPTHCHEYWSEVNQSPHPSHYFCLLFIGHSHHNRCEVTSHCGFDLHFLDAYDTEHLPLYLLTICMSSLEIFSSFFNKVIRVFLFNCWVVGIPYSIWKLVSHLIYDWQIFSPIPQVTCSLSHFLYCAEALLFDEVPHADFCFRCLCFGGGVISVKSLLRQIPLQKAVWAFLLKW